MKEVSQPLKVYKDLAKATGVPEETVARVIEELGLRDVKQAGSNLKKVTINELRLAFRAALIAVVP